MKPFQIPQGTISLPLSNDFPQRIIYIAPTRIKIKKIGNVTFTLKLNIRKPNIAKDRMQ